MIRLSPSRKIVLRFFIFSSSLFLTVGCAKISHLDQLLTLKDLSEEQERLDRYTREQDRKFEFLVKVVKDGTVKRYANQKSILKNFGEPVYKEEMTRGNQKARRWVYRYTAEFFDSPKVYLDFDAEGHLLQWELLPGGGHGTN